MTISCKDPGVRLPCSFRGTRIGPLNTVGEDAGADATRHRADPGLGSFRSRAGPARRPRIPPGAAPPAPSREPSRVDWSPGAILSVRVPVASPGREYMSAISFPEGTLDTAIAGWPEGELTAIQKKGLLFLRLAKKSEGQLNVLGGSGTHYLLFLKGVENPAPDTYDAYLEIRKTPEARPAEIPLARREQRPSQALLLLQAMRRGLRLDGIRILRARGELAYESPVLEIRLLTLYDAPGFLGLIYDVRNRSSERQALDASRLRGKGTQLVLTALKDNLLGAGSATRLYAVMVKE